MLNEAVPLELLEEVGSSNRSVNLINRYCRFIQLCMRKDAQKSYTETHHILPRSVWSEYENLTDVSWNAVVLTARQHFVAHWILARLLGGSQWNALFLMMQRNYNPVGYSRAYEALQKKAAIKIGEFHKERLSDPEEKRKHTERITKAVRTPETRDRMSKAQKKYFSYPVNRKKHSDRMKRTHRTQEFSDKQSEALKAAYKDPEKKCRHKEVRNTPEYRENQSKSLKAAFQDPELRQKMSDAGKRFNATPVICPHCGKSGGMSGMRRWHFDRCKQNPNPNEETKRRLRQSEQLSRQGKTKEAKERLSKARDKFNADTENRQRVSEQRIRANKEQVECPHCSKVGGETAMLQWHFDNCKHKATQEA